MGVPHMHDLLAQMPDLNLCWFFGRTLPAHACVKGASSPSGQEVDHLNQLLRWFLITDKSPNFLNPCLNLSGLKIMDCECTLHYLVL